jgi:hypothetical protein
VARLAGSLIKLRTQIDELAPGRAKASDGWIGDAAHAARKSDHNPDASGVVRALDITHDPAHGVDAGAIAEQIRQSRDPRVSYIISNSRIANPDIQDWAWRLYDGSNPHDKHFHVSVVADALADEQEPWAVSLSAPADEVSIARPRLGLGSKGPAVTEAQKLLGVEADGYFGTITQAAVVNFQAAHGLEPDGWIGPYTWDALLSQQGPLAPPVPRQTGIIATVFSSAETGQKGAYGDYLEPSQIFLALPATLPRGTPVRVYGPSGSAVAPVLDKGPWNVNDPYWLTGTRPQAETGTDTRGRKTNWAGIDLSPALAAAVGINGKGKVDWEFVTAPAPEPVPPPLPVPPPIPEFPFPFPFPLPGTPPQPTGDSPFNRSMGDFFSVIARLPRISALMRRLPKNLTLEDYTAAVEIGLTRLADGPGAPVPPPVPAPPPTKGAPAVIINWKTTGTGIATLLTGITALVTMFTTGHFDPTVLTTALGSITAGLGLIFAKDKEVTGGTVKQ